MENTRNVTVTLATGDDLEALVSGNAAMARETEAKELDLEALRRGVGAVLADANKGFYLVARLGTSRGCIAAGAATRSVLEVPRGTSSDGGASGCIAAGAATRSVLEVPRGTSSDGGASGCIAQLMITFEWSDWRARPIWWIQSVYVLPEARRRGVYRALYAEVMRRAAEADVCAVRLYVERTNGSAKETYRALGMSPSHYDLFEVELGS